MARVDVNRSGELEVFVRVVELGGFSAAARKLRMTPSAVSKLVSRLEARLGARLVQRSTRRLELTPEGRAFYERGVGILAELDAAERAASASELAAGHLKVSAHVPFGVDFLLPTLPAFLAAHPRVSVEAVLTDKVVDLLEERTDIAVRSGPLKSSQLVARKLGETRMVIVAAPAYLARAGIPETPEDLEQHNRLTLCYAREMDGWPLRTPGGEIRHVPAGNAMVNDGESLRRLVVEGLGLARLGLFQVAEDIAAGRLVPVLEAFNPGDTDPLHAVYLGQGGPLPARVRAFLDHLAAHVAPRFSALALADPEALARKASGDPT
ncbi:LysR family transcriptional regulator [Aquabacter sp. CN5-332]|uniref:LysR family transcriptional regulator n=1 Tax=Aquabacter sp. CN5-332 TaxID=3156608 RepID=UPI0032B37021